MQFIVWQMHQKALCHCLAATGIQITLYSVNLTDVLCTCHEQKPYLNCPHAPFHIHNRSVYPTRTDHRSRMPGGMDQLSIPSPSRAMDAFVPHNYSAGTLSVADERQAIPECLGYVYTRD